MIQKNKKILLIFLGLCIGIICIIICTQIIKSKYINTKLSIAILVISMDNDKNAGSQNKTTSELASRKKSWKLEKKYWKSKYKFSQSIDVFLLECNRESYTKIFKQDCNRESYTKIFKQDCVESFKPGIFQKTILAIEKLLPHKYDYYIRTNLSTFIINNKLFKYLNTLGKKNEPIYRGVYCRAYKNYHFVGGYGIILNAQAAKKLVEFGKHEKNFNDSHEADDVLIGKIMKNIGVVCKNESLDYLWNYNKDIPTNIKNINLIIKSLSSFPIITIKI